MTRTDLDPVTVGVNAPWGGGKTTVLQLPNGASSPEKTSLPRGHGRTRVSLREYDNKTDPTTALIDEVLSGMQKKLEDAKGFGDRGEGHAH